jgi:NADH dehydrogenase FAD-containing subunit
MEHIVIIGNGIAGVTLHVTYANNPKIKLLSFHQRPNFLSRTALMYVFMGHMKFEHTQPYKTIFGKKIILN